jgi:hypothetical protein
MKSQPNICSAKDNREGNWGWAALLRKLGHRFAASDLKES